MQLDSLRGSVESLATLSSLPSCMRHFRCIDSTLDSPRFLTMFSVFPRMFPRDLNHPTFMPMISGQSKIYTNVMHPRVLSRMFPTFDPS